MKKVMLSRKQADAVECAKYMDTKMLLRRHSLDVKGSEFTGKLAPLSDMSMNTLKRALKEGYEVEQ